MNILDLPVEVRLQIYQGLIIHDRPYEDHPWGAHLIASWAYRFHRGVLAVNRQMHQEAMTIFYGMNQLRFYVNSKPRKTENSKAFSISLFAFRNSLCFQFIQYLSFDIYLSCSSINPIENCPDLYDHICKAQTTFEEICLIVNEVPELKAIEIAWTDEICFGRWEMKAMLLNPLGIFPSTCAFIIDEIEIPFLLCPTKEEFSEYVQGITGVVPTWKTSNYWNDPSCLLSKLTIQD